MKESWIWKKPVMLHGENAEACLVVSQTDGTGVRVPIALFQSILRAASKNEETSLVFSPKSVFAFLRKYGQNPLRRVFGTLRVVLASTLTRRDQCPYANIAYSFPISGFDAVNKIPLEVRRY
jgi:hypothetical protein